MPDAGNISKVQLPDGNTYSIKDTVSGYTTNIGTITEVSLNGTTVATSGKAELQIASTAVSVTANTHTLNITTNITNGDGVSY